MSSTENFVTLYVLTDGLSHCHSVYDTTITTLLFSESNLVPELSWTD